MSDSFTVVMNDGTLIHLGNAACFAPLNCFKGAMRYQSSMKCRDVDAEVENGLKPVSLIYHVPNSRELDRRKFMNVILGIQSVPMINKIVSRVTLVEGCAAEIILDMSYPIDAVLWALGAFREVKENRRRALLLADLMPSVEGEVSDYRYTAFILKVAANYREDGGFSEYGESHKNNPLISLRGFSLLLGPAEHVFSQCKQEPLHENNWGYVHGWGNVLNEDSYSTSYFKAGDKVSKAVRAKSQDMLRDCFKELEEKLKPPVKAKAKVKKPAKAKARKFDPMFLRSIAKPRDKLGRFSRKTVNVNLKAFLARTSYEGIEAYRPNRNLPQFMGEHREWA